MPLLSTAVSQGWKILAFPPLIWITAELPTDIGHLIPRTKRLNPLLNTDIKRCLELILRDAKLPLEIMRLHSCESRSVSNRAPGYLLPFLPIKEQPQPSLASLRAKVLEECGRILSPDCLMDEGCGSWGA